MKVVVIGATGFVGSFTIIRCLSDSAITQVLALTRKPLSSSAYLSSEARSSPKLVEIIHDDFLSYPDDLLAQLQGVQACLWCIGGRHTQQSRWKTEEEYVLVSVDFTVKAAEAFRERLAPQVPQPGKFRFVFCSGHATELDQEKSLWVMGRTRKVKGMAEQALFDLSRGNAENSAFEAYTVRPCGIYQKNPSLKDTFMTTFVLPSCHVEELAAVMVETAKSGCEEQIVVHDKIREWGARLLNHGKTEG